MIEIDVRIPAELRGKLDIKQPVRTALLAGATHLKSKLAAYPRQWPRSAVWSANPTKAALQRAGFFAKLRSGEIQVPYRRGQSSGSQNLGQRWTLEVKPDGWSANVGNNASYAPYVQGEKQTRYHWSGGWPTVKEVRDQEEKTVRQIFAEIIGRFIRGGQ